MIVNDKFNQALIQKIQNLLPSGKARIRLLTDTVSLGREAAYRRLRGEVLFTFEEACKIAFKLGLSLDSLMDVPIRENNPEFHLASLPIKASIGNPVETYFSSILSGHKQFGEMVNDPKLLTMGVFSYIPHVMFFPYPDLLRFGVLMWSYQFMDTPLKLSEITLSKEYEEKFKELSFFLTNIHKQVFIFDYFIFYSLCNKINYFYDLNYISAEEKHLLAEELIKMLSVLEVKASIGKTQSKKDVWLYLSHLTFNANYTYAQGTTFKRSYIEVYHLNTLVSSDPLICKTHKKWIESYRKYSMLISAGREKERTGFFRLQERFIERLF
ncbi:MAG: hypothetical protein LBL58_06320 [Tannerellaceae bacterium]|jgi:hypothetical protein|nr:hypothetical protein [Tannerellaceae bacterium]